jgi:SNF2 family DNA or RNA helicase
MQNTLIAAVESGEVIAANAAVASSKCRQIANGGIYLNSLDGTYEDLHDAKLDALDDLIEELSGESLLVVYEFGFDLDRLIKKFPKLVRLTTGNQRKDAEEIAKFSSGLTKLAAGQFSSISLGLDGLQNSCHHVCMFGLTWNLQDYIQTIDRVHRSGQKFDVTIHRILAKDTVDERVLSILDAKNRTQEGFLSVLKSLRAA